MTLDDVRVRISHLHLLLGLLAAAACDESLPRTELLVAVHSDLQSGVELTGLEARLLDRTGERELRRVRFELERSGDRALPLSFSVAPDDALGAESVRLVVTGRGPSPDDATATRDLVEQQVIVWFTPGRSKRVEVYLSSHCLGELCREGGEAGDLSCDARTGACAAVPVLTELPDVSGRGLGGLQPVPFEGMPRAVDAGTVSDAGSDGAAGPDAGSDSGTRDGSIPDPLFSGADIAVATFGAECPLEGERACTEEAGANPLICESGVWTSAGSCGSAGLCDTRVGATQGQCLPIVDGCVDRRPQEAFCLDGDRRRCGRDLVDAPQDACPERSVCDESATGSEGCRCEPDTVWVEGACLHVDDCADDPCGFGGAQCQDGVESFECTCQGLWKGSTCRDYGVRWGGISSFVVSEEGRFAYVLGTTAYSQQVALIEVDLVQGSSRLVSGFTEVGEAVGSGPSLEYATTPLPSPDGEEVFVVDWGYRSVLAIDLDTGDRRVLSGTRDTESRGAGPDLSSPRTMVLSADGLSLYLTDRGHRAIFQVEIASGDREVLSDDDHEGDRYGVGGPFGRPQELALDAARGRLLVAENAASMVWAVDTTTGDRSLFSGVNRNDENETRGEGPEVYSPTGVGLNAAATHLWLRSGTQIFRMDLETGDREVLFGVASSSPEDEGPGILPPGAGLGVLDADTVVTLGERLLVVHLDTGVVESSPREGSGAGPGFATVVDLWEAAAEPGTVWALDSALGTLSSVATAHGDRQAHTSALSAPRGMVRTDDGRFFVADAGRRAIVELQAETFGARVFSGPNSLGTVRGTGPGWLAPAGVEYDAANGRLLVVDMLHAAVLGVDLADGDRTVVSAASLGGASYGAGPGFVAPTGLVLDDAGQLWVTDAGLNALLRVDPMSGQREVVSGCGTDACLPAGVEGAGPMLEDPRGVVIDTVNGRALVADAVQHAVFAVNLVNGLRTVLSGCQTAGCAGGLVAGAGPPLGPAAALSFASGRLLVGAGSLILRVDPVTGARSYFSMAD